MRPRSLGASLECRIVNEALRLNVEFRIVNAQPKETFRVFSVFRG